MTETMKEIEVADDDGVPTEDIPLALTVRNLVYDNGATQVFHPSGVTTYVERGRKTQVGEWYVDVDGHFCSFWPPNHRACYSLRWIVEDGTVVGLSFTEVRGGARFDGRYR